MWQHQMVMHRDRDDDAQVVFLGGAEHRSDDLRVYYMPRSLFEEMGKPEIITLAVVVGDRLNP